MARRAAEAPPAPEPAAEAAGARRAATWLVDHSGWVLLGLVLATAALAWPAVGLQPSTIASNAPEGPVFTAARLAAERLAPAAERTVFLVEARQENLLDREPLLELWRNEQALRRDPKVGPKLIRARDPRTGAVVDGLASVADAVDGVLRAGGGGGLEAAGAAEVDGAVRRLLELKSPAALGLSTHTTRQPDGSWRSPAAVLYLFADHEALAPEAAAAEGGEVVEHFNRAALALLRGDQRQLRVWGIAIDVDLTSAEQGRAAGPYIGWTILAVLLVVGMAFRSYFAVALSGAALGALMLWLEGLSNLLGLASSQILSTIVPIAMISFGIDFALHGVGRYREHRQAGLAPRRALVVGFSGVLAALLLAASSDAAAFLSNTATGIESLVEFGIAAALAQLSALALLGIGVPLGLMRIEGPLAGRRWSWRGRVVGALGVLAAALVAMAAVILLVFVEPWQGLLLLAGHFVAFVLAPAWLLRPRRSTSQGAVAGAVAAGGGWPWVGRLVVAIARRRRIVLPAALVATVLCGYYATRVEPRFAVRDFFSADSDFVVGLDRLEHHLGSQGGEPAIVYVESDLARPEALRALARLRDRLVALPTDRLARNERGEVAVDAGLLAVVEQAWAAPELRAAVRDEVAAVSAAGGADELPGSAAELAALYRIVLARGVPAADGRPARSAADVAEVLWQAAGPPRRHATRLGVRLPRSQSQEHLAAVRAVLGPLVDGLRDDLARLDPSARAVLTGAPIVRQATLAAILRAFRLSLPVAVLLCFLVAAAFMRSLRYALTSIVPILLVVAWLYATMYAFDVPINVVSATIGAVSIGIGIDFAVHFAMRYREERRRPAGAEAALYQAGCGTGTALLTSAASSIVGFAILALAPMPLFASYGLLTAVMLAMAAAATLLVLPALLVLVDRPAP